MTTLIISITITIISITITIISITITIISITFTIISITIIIILITITIISITITITSRTTMTILTAIMMLLIPLLNVCLQTESYRSQKQNIKNFWGGFPARRSRGKSKQKFRNLIPGRSLVHHDSDVCPMRVEMEKRQ